MSGVRARRAGAQYLFAAGVSFGSWLSFLAARQLLPIGDSFTPFLPGFAGLVASALWTGLGPSLLASVITTAWCIFENHASHRFSWQGEYLRDAVFIAEGMLLCLVSARLRATINRLARSEDWHRQLVETSVEGIWVIGGDGRILYANPRIGELLGYPLEVLQGSQLQDYCFPADLPVERIRLQNRRAGLRDQFDRRLRRGDGSEAWFLDSSSPVFDENGVQLGVLSMMTDITERKRAETALRRSEIRFRELFENVLEGVYQSTPEGRILDANPMLLRMLGLDSPTQLNEINIARDLYVDSTVRRRMLDRLENEGFLHDAEYQLRRRDGRIITVRENARTVRGEDGGILYYEGTLADVTDRLSLEAQVRRAHRAEGLGRLAAGVAQDFNNVLTVISGYAQLVLTEIPGSHPARENAVRVAQAADSASGLAQQLLSFSLRQADEPVPVDFARVLAEISPRIRERLGLGSELVVSCSGDELWVVADEQQLGQILVSISTGTKDVVPECSKLEIRAELVSVDPAFCRIWPEARPGLYVAISTRCVGSNFQALEPGFVAAAIPGLGLATTRAIVSQYGGFMILESQVDRAFSVSVYLPRSHRMASGSTGVFGRTARRSSAAILLIEPDPLLREVSRDMLERQGHHVRCSSRLVECDLVAGTLDAFDLLVFGEGAGQPSRVGCEMARKLRLKQPDLKVLFISGYNTESASFGPVAVSSYQPLHSEGNESGGADAILERPFSFDALGDAVQQLLDRT